MWCVLYLILLTTGTDRLRQRCDGLDRQQLRLVERVSTSSLVSFPLCVPILGLSYTNSNTHFTNRSEVRTITKQRDGT